MKNLPVSAVVELAASVMSPPFAASRVATAATMPGRLSQRGSGRAGAIARLDLRVSSERCSLRAPAPRACLRRFAQARHAADI